MTLSERVEALEGADRSVDAEIIAALNNALVKPYPPATDFGPHDRWQFWSLDGKHFLGSEAKFNVPLLTSSIDAALTLLPEGWDWLVRKDHSARLAFANVSEPHRIAVIDTFCEEDQAWRASDTTGANVSLAPTPCLALLAAILKARGL